MAIEDGGNAFPVIVSLNNSSTGVVTSVYTYDGMTLRDYFAAKALSGLLSYPGGEGNGSFISNCDKDGVADVAYTYADAMLKRRKT
jgi:hypothetical protein